MTYYNFNPFNKNIDEITGEDLIVLKDISEGWYVDYKENIINIKKTAKHMSAFANQFGGWLFFGIKESETRTAGHYLGINKDKVCELLISIREAVSAHSSPEIYYTENII
jgi:predicted HTH transcriptional regulator